MRAWSRAGQQVVKPDLAAGQRLRQGTEGQTAGAQILRDAQRAAVDGVADRFRVTFAYRASALVTLGFGDELGSLESAEEPPLVIVLLQLGPLCRGRRAARLENATGASRVKARA
jgi:hypothetical protein